MDMHKQTADEETRPDDYRVMFDPLAPAAEQPANLRLLRGKLANTLVELGKLDWELKAVLDALRSDIADGSYDGLNGQVAGLLEPEVRGAITHLAERLTSAVEVVDALLPEAAGRRHSN